MWVLGLSLLKLLEADVLLGLCHLSSSSKSIVYHPQICPSPFASAATPPSESRGRFSLEHGRRDDFQCFSAGRREQLPKG